MKRITTLNEDKGCKISDLEALLIVMGKLMDDKIEEKPNAGITLAKGKKNERKIRYAEARKLLTQLSDYFGAKGCLSLGICDTCRSFDQRPTANKAFGICKKSGVHCHRWDSCPSHSNPEEGTAYEHE